MGLRLISKLILMARVGHYKQCCQLVLCLHIKQPAVRSPDWCTAQTIYHKGGGWYVQCIALQHFWHLVFFLWSLWLTLKLLWSISYLYTSRFHHRSNYNLLPRYKRPHSYMYIATEIWHWKLEPWTKSQPDIYCSYFSPTITIHKRCEASTYLVQCW